MDSHIITEYGKQNIFAKEVKPYIDEDYKGYGIEAEKSNGRWAMIGIVAALGSYVITGQIIPGIW
tara:strand:- start:3053 stop:3247 length:195 start_codon:yes stop_codon:yes gene_type:complete